MQLDIEKENICTARISLHTTEYMHSLVTKLKCRMRLAPHDRKGEERKREKKKRESASILILFFEHKEYMAVNFL